MTKEEAAARATLIGARGLGFTRHMYGDAPPLILVLVAQVESSEGPVNVAMSWPADRKADAAEVAAEAGEVFDRQAAGE